MYDHNEQLSRLPPKLRRTIPTNMPDKAAPPRNHHRMPLPSSPSAVLAVLITLGTVVAWLSIPAPKKESEYLYTGGGKDGEAKPDMMGKHPKPKRMLE
ncbi:hypothetical protein DFJ74DRAFT_703218 [Hyaloraphidium curvatum]|nr:hypothetical protein DFJ74DRAFT_703218 [Hyaloraphidium curvatum]